MNVMINIKSDHCLYQEKQKKRFPLGHFDNVQREIYESNRTFIKKIQMKKI